MITRSTFDSSLVVVDGSLVLWVSCIHIIYWYVRACAGVGVCACVHDIVVCVCACVVEGSLYYCHAKLLFFSGHGKHPVA